MAIISVEDLVDYGSLGTLAAGQTTAASVIIDDLSAELEGYLRRKLEPTELVHDATLDFSFDGTIYLPWSPVTAVASVAVDGEAVSSSYWNINGSRSGVENLRLLSPSLSTTAPPVVAIAYTAGWTDATRPPEIAPALRRVALREFTRTVLDKNPGVANASVEGESISYAGVSSAGGVTGWHEEDLKKLRRHRRRKVR